VGIVPATFKPAEERRLAKEASTRIEVVPATYEMVEEQVLVKPASSHLEAVPAVFETVTTQVLEKAGYTFWKKGTGPITKVDNATGEILCLVEVPPVYRTVTSQVLKTPATTREIADPAVYSTVKHQVVKTPATTRVIEIPAEYQTVQMTQLIDPAGSVRTPIAAEYQTVPETTLVSGERFEWQSIMCETNTPAAPAPVKTMKMQPAPKTSGYDASANKTQNDASFFKSAQGTWWAPVTSGDTGYRN
jgi:hypothetical protein